MENLFLLTSVHRDSLASHGHGIARHNREFAHTSFPSIHRREMSNAHTTYNSSAGREDERSRLCQLKVKDLLKELVARGVDVASLAALEKSELVDALLAAPPAALPRVVAMDAAEAEEGAGESHRLAAEVKARVA